MTNFKNRKSIKSLVGKSGVDVAIKCFNSLEKHCTTNIKIEVYGDGSLEEESKDKIKNSIENVKIYEEKKRREKVFDWLDGYENCIWMREESNYSMKLFDIMVGEEGYVHFCDSDILFVRNFKDFFECEGFECQFSTSGSLRNGYSLSPKSIPPMGEIGMVDSLNSGLFSFNSKNFDLDYLDWVIGRMREEGGFERRSTWTEQTCWSALASRIDCRLFSFDSVTIPRNSFLDGGIKINADEKKVIAVHFVSPVRSYIDSFETTKYSSTVHVERFVPKKNNSFRQFLSDVKLGIGKRLEGALA